MAKSVSVNLNDVKPSENDVKVDLDAPKEDIKDTTVVEPSDDEEGKQEESKESKEEESPEDKEDTSEKYDNGFVDLDEEKKEESKEEKIVLSKEDYEKKLQEAKESSKAEALKEFQDKYKPNEQKSENIRLHQKNEELQSQLSQMDSSSYLVVEKQNEIYKNFFDSHKDVLPETSKKALLGYQKTGDAELVKNDPYLSRLDKKLSKIILTNPKNPLVDLEERLEDAFSLAFHKEISESRVKQSQAELEMKKQREEKMVENGQRSAERPKGKSLTDNQQKVFDIWGIKPQS